MKQLTTEGRKLLTGILLICALLIAAACERAPLKPAGIGPDDTCFYCKSPISSGSDNSQLVAAAEFITKTGFVRKFDDFGCLIANAKKVGKKNIEVFFAIDVESRTWFPAEQLHFIRSDKIRTPKNSGIIAFRDAARAQKVAAQYQAELVKLDDLIE